MVQKLILAAATAAVIGVLAAMGTTAEAGHRHHNHHGNSHGGGYYGGHYGGGVVYAPRVYAQPVYPYPVYQNYGPTCVHSPYGGGGGYGYGYGNGYGYGGYAPYGQSIGVRSGNFSLYLGR